MSKHNDYKPGNPEYDFWNDKNLYPDLRNDEDDFFTSQHRHQLKSPRPTTPEDHKTGFGTVFLVAFVWLIFFAPFAFFFTWEDSIVQFIFWTGIIIITITYIVAFYNAIQAEKRKKK